MLILQEMDFQLPVLTLKVESCELIMVTLNICMHGSLSE